MTLVITELQQTQVDQLKDRVVFVQAFTQEMCKGLPMRYMSIPDKIMDTIRAKNHKLRMEVGPVKKIHICTGQDIIDAAQKIPATEKVYGGSNGMDFVLKALEKTTDLYELADTIAPEKFESAKEEAPTTFQEETHALDAETLEIITPLHSVGDDRISLRTIFQFASERVITTQEAEHNGQTTIAGPDIKSFAEFGNKDYLEKMRAALKRHLP